MRFGSNIVEHQPFSVPMVGNAATGYSIGLTPQGAAVCHRMFSEDVAEDEVAAVDENLLTHLKRGRFHCADVPADVVRSAYLHVTHRCNLRCVGCYSGVPDRNGRADMPLDEVQLIVDRLAAAGVERLVISGGEPFLRDDLPLIAERARTAGIRWVDVLTNGTVVTAEKLRALAPFVDRVSVSFDGADADSVPAIRRENRFDELVRAVELIREAGIGAHIIPTVHVGNIGDMAAYRVLAERLGATLNFSLLSAAADDGELAALIPDEEALDALARETLALSGGPGEVLADTPVNTGLATTTGCGAGCAMVSVSADGEVFPCHMLHDEAFRIGSLVEEPACLANRSRPAGPVDELPECGTCEIRYLCGGGCRARAFFATGDVTARDPYCTLMKTFYRLLFQAMLGKS